MKLKPLGDRVLVKQDDAETTTKSGLIIPDNAQEKPQTGRVLDIGNECKDVSIGDQILFGRYAGQELDFDQQKYLIMRESDVIAVLDE
jgi:chaperonin GroES